jgi:RNA polymerase sigma-70 factor (ECF subfamily)
MHALTITLPPGLWPYGLPAPFSLSDSSSPRPTIESLVREHFQLVWRTLRRFGLSDADADDGAQEVFLIVDKKLPTIDLGKEKAFLVSVARRVASTKRRSLSRRREDAGVEVVERATDDHSPEEVSSLRQAREQLERILDSMPSEVREVFVLFELERFTGPEIARTLELPEGTVSTRLRKGREIFRVAAARLAPAGPSSNQGGLDE